MNRVLFAIILTFTSAGFSEGQTIIQPNYGLKSHETLVINRIETTDRATTFFLTVENRRDGGSFCADRNIYMKYPDGTRTKMVISSGIPVCPDSYKFKAIGEKLNFSLTFQPLKPGTKYVDLVEECSENCFYFYGIILNAELNSKIDNAFILAGSRESAKALSSFSDILGSKEIKNSGAEGLLYVNLIKLSSDSGNSTLAKQWYDKLLSSGISELPRYIRFLNDQGLRY